MNKIYRVIWNSLMQCYVVASEFAKGKTKSQSTGRVALPNRTLALSGVAVAIALACSHSVMAATTIIADGTTVVADGQDIVATGNRATVGQNSMGLSAGNGGDITFTNGTITTTGTGGLGMASNNGSLITISDSDISTAGARAHGIYSANSANVLADRVHITTTGGTAYGVQTDNGSLTLQNSTINTTGAAAAGAWAQGSTGNLTISGSNITTSGEKAQALYAMSGGNMTVDNSTIAATGHMSQAVLATGAGTVININNSKLSTSGSSSEAVYAQKGATINVTNSDIFTNRINSYGLRTFDAGSTINFDGGTITTTGSTPTVQAYSADSQINVRNATINTSQSGLVALFGSVSAENVIINNDGASPSTVINYGAGTRYSGGTVNLKNVQINSRAADQIGVIAAGGGNVTLEGVELNHSLQGTAIAVQNGGILSGNNVQVNMAGGSAVGLYLQSDNTGSTNTLSLSNSAVSVGDGTAMAVADAADDTVNLSGTALTGTTLLSVGENNAVGTLSNMTLNGDNGSVFNGDVVINRAATGRNEINLDNNSVWTGATSTLENLTVSNGSQWNVTHDSAVDNLTLNNGTLNMTAPGTGFSQVTLGSLNSTDGTLSFKTHLVGDDSLTDHLHITGDYSGDSKVTVQNAGGTGAKTIDGIELIKVDGAVNGSFTQQGRIVAGAYDYNLVQKGQQWLLESDAAPNGGASGGASGGPVGGGSTSPVKRITRPEAGSYMANLAAANNMFGTSLDDRSGETRYVDAAGNEHSTSLWMRNEGGHTRFSGSTGQIKTQTNRYVLQLGGDIAQWSSSGDDRFHLGVMAGYGNAKSNSQSGVTGYSSKGQVSGYSSGLYATWLQNSADNTGAFVDSWMLYNWFDNSVSGQGIAQESYKSKGITAAVESGYNFKVADLDERQSVYVQPKAQLSWMGVKADDHKELNGTRVTGEGNNNLQSRLGVRAYIKGHNAIDDGKNRTFEPFVEANWVHNTEAFGANMNGVTIQQAGTKNMAELKVGVDAKLNNSVNLWGNIGQQMGDKSYSDTSAMLGVKVNF